jgi:hypothetical protein
LEGHAHSSLKRIPLCPIPLNRQRFQRGSRQVAAAGNKLRGKLIGNFDGYLHTKRLPPSQFPANGFHPSLTLQYNQGCYIPCPLPARKMGRQNPLRSLADVP